VCGVLQSKSDTGHDDVAGVLMGVVMVWTSFWSFKFCNISLFIEIIFSNQEVLKNKNNQLICEKNTWKSGMDWVGLYLLLHPSLWLCIYFAWHSWCCDGIFFCYGKFIECVWSLKSPKGESSAWVVGAFWFIVKFF
jgi:hypothetical protein